jgi:hypothetical protein
MEQRLAQLKEKEAELWKRLEDPMLLHIEKEAIEAQINGLHNKIVELRLRILGFTVKYEFDD